MSVELQRFLSSLDTAASIESALVAVRECSAVECGDVLESYARSLGFDFTSSEAALWLAEFRDSIADAYLRRRFHTMRLRHTNDWAAFFALELEIKISTPEEEYLGNRWEAGESDVPPLGRGRRFRGLEIVAGLRKFVSKLRRIGLR